MESTEPSSRFANLSRNQVLAVVAATLALLGWCLTTALTEKTLPDSEETKKLAVDSDEVFYRNVIVRIRSGQNYYDAVLDESKDPRWTRYGFRPTSVFNWRTPTYAWVIGKGPDPVLAQGLLGLLALATTVMAFVILHDEVGPRWAFLALLLSGPFALCMFGSFFLFTELWGGVLIALSVCAYSLGRWPVGAAAGLAALFFRELALPYCLICMALAAQERRRSEAASWIVGLLLYMLFYSFHTHEVMQRVTSPDMVQASHWVRFGGLAFVIGTSQMNILLIQLPAVVAAVCLPLSLLGLAGWKSPTGLRAGLTTGFYILAFSVVGMAYNAYWGLMYTPLLALGLAALPITIRDLYRGLNS